MAAALPSLAILVVPAKEASNTQRSRKPYKERAVIAVATGGGRFRRKGGCRLNVTGGVRKWNGMPGLVECSGQWLRVKICYLNAAGGGLGGRKVLLECCGRWARGGGKVFVKCHGQWVEEVGLVECGKRQVMGWWEGGVVVTERGHFFKHP